jgi:hypothetical protein
MTDRKQANSAEAALQAIAMFPRMSLDVFAESMFCPKDRPRCT